jgi:D-sedoheptulose 7-phosphate isomerase
MDVVSATRVGRRWGARRDAIASFKDRAADLACAAQDVASRFARGGTLLTFGFGHAATDAQHIAVEFVHPVIVGKRALPAIALVNDVVAGANYADQLRALGREQDVAIAVSLLPDASIVEALVQARAMGMLTLGLLGGSIDAPIHHPIVIGAADPFVFKEACVAAYHILWELVHVTLERTDIAGTL